MKIRVFGPGCPNCVKTEALVREVVASLAVPAEVEKVTDYPEMLKAGVMATPAVSVDGDLKVTGRVPHAEEVRAWLTAPRA